MEQSWNGELIKFMISGSCLTATADMQVTLKELGSIAGQEVTAVQD